MEGESVVSFKDGQAGVEQLALRDHDDVEPGRDLGATENLSNQSFRSVSLNSAPHFPGGGDSEATYDALVREHEHGEPSTVRPGPVFVDPLKFRAAADALLRAKALGPIQN